MVRVGCSGWNYRSWRGAFYPQRTPASRWLEHYATRFDTVEVNSTFCERNVALVAAHRKGLEAPLDVVTADFAFLRFHYGERGRHGNYSATELDAWAQRIRALERAQLDVYAYFNNDWEAFAPRNALALRARL